MMRLRIFALLVAFFFSSTCVATLIRSTDNFLVLSDIHLNVATQHTMDISPSENNGENDLDLKSFSYLITTLYENIEQGNIRRPKFIVLLGDINGHRIDSMTDVVKNEAAVFKILKANFPTTPIFYTFGNNDSLEADYGLFDNPEHSGEVNSPYDVAIQDSGWKNGFLSSGIKCTNAKKYPCLISENATAGYYAAYFENGLRMISLNSVLFSPRRTQVTHQMVVHQFNWLQRQLASAAAKNESVLLAMHIPPGNNVYDNAAFWLAPEQAVFFNIITQYRSNLIGILAAHTHAAEIKIIKDVAKKNLTGVFITPGLSTSHGNEPAVTSFDFNKKNNKWQLSNYKTFHFSQLSQQDQHINFDELYDYNNYYCNNKNQGLLQCLNNVTANKIKKYFSAGNKNYPGVMDYPENFVFKISGSY